MYLQKNGLFFFLIFSVFTLSADFKTEFDETASVKQSKNRQISFRTGNGISGVLFQKDLSTLKVTATAEGLVIDASKETVSRKSPVLIRFFLSKQDQAEDAFRGKKLTSEVTVKADRTASGTILIEGRRNGKHYHKGRIVPVGTAFQIQRFSEQIPEGVEGLSLRFDLHTPAIYTIRGAGMRAVVETIRPDNRNQIVNGGAERGWYGTYIDDLNAKGVNGKEIRFDGKIIDFGRKFAIDDKVFYSGRHSFRIEGKPYATGSFYLNPVKYIPGQPFTVSFRAKAEKPGTPLNFGLFLGFSRTYAIPLTAGTEWKKYEITIPRWGEKAPGITPFGDVVKGSIFEEVYPRFDPFGTVWIDDFACSSGTQAPFENDPLFLRGTLNSPSSYYKEGETIRMLMEVENPGIAVKNAELTYHIRDFFGKTLFTSPATRLSIAPNATVKQEIPVANVPKGAFNLIVELRIPETGKTIRHAFLTGVIGKTEKKIARLGLDAPIQGNPELLIPVFNDFRIGTVRLWGSYNTAVRDYTGTKRIDAFHNAGVQILLNIGDTHKLPFVRKDMTPWKDFLKKALKPYAGKVALYEVANEPNAWSGQGKKKDPALFDDISPVTYVRMLKAASEAVHEIDPGAKIGGPTTCGTDLSFTESVLAHGGAKYLDVITEHPYRTLPELPDYESDLTAMKQIASRYSPKRKIPIWASESGSQNSALLRDNLIDEKTRNALAKDIRNMLISYACGNEVYIHFAAAPYGIGIGWNVFYGGNPDTFSRPVPSPMLYAMRTVADLIGNAAPAGKIKLGSDFRCYVFDNGSERTIALWKWNGEPVQISSWKSLDPAMKAYDIMGNILSPSVPLPLSIFPVYLKTKRSFPELEQAFSKLSLTTGNSVATSVSVSGKNSFNIRLTNRNNRPLSGTLAVTIEGKTQKQTFRDLPAEESRTLQFRTGREISTVPQKGTFTVATATGKQEESFQLKSAFAPRAGKEITIDGDLSDWPEGNSILLTVPQNAVRRAPNLWKPEDSAIKAEIKTAWNESALYIAVTVFKQGLFQDSHSAAEVWRGDSVQFAFDPLKNAAPDTAKYQDDDFEYAISLLNGRPVLYRQYASSAVHDSLLKATGELKNGTEVQTAIRQLPDRTIYETAFTPRAVSPFKLKAGSSMRWSVLVNLNNGNGRLGWLELTDGIGDKKRPGQFLDLILLP